MSGGEIVLTGPAGGVAFGGTSGFNAHGFPASVAAGTTATSTKVASSLATVVNTIVDWALTEVGRDPVASATTSPLDGGWVAWDWQRTPAPVEDGRRLFVYQHGLYNAMHVGVNGISNMQEACYVDEIQSAGSWVKQSSRSTAGAGAAASAGCSMRQYSIAAGETLQQVLTANNAAGIACAAAAAPFTSTCTALSATTGDFPSTIGNVILPDYPGRWPQSQTQDATDGRPVSVVDYEIRPANSVPSDPVCPTVDKLTVWDTQSGVRKDTLSPAIPASCFAGSRPTDPPEPGVSRTQPALPLPRVPGIGTRQPELLRPSRNRMGVRSPSDARTMQRQNNRPACDSKKLRQLTTRFKWRVGAVRLDAGALLCGLLLAGCNAASDGGPSTTAPAQTVVLQGTVTGLGTRRPLVLQYNGADMCINSAAPTGPPRGVQVLQCAQPADFRIQLRRVAGGYALQHHREDAALRQAVHGEQWRGTLSTMPASITVTCVNDGAVPRFPSAGTWLRVWPRCPARRWCSPPRKVCARWC